MHHPSAVANALSRTATALLQPTPGSARMPPWAPYVLHTLARVVAMQGGVCEPYVHVALDAWQRWHDGDSKADVTQAALQVCLCVALVQQPACTAAVRERVLAATARLGRATCTPAVAALHGHVLYAVLARADSLDACVGVFHNLVQLAAACPAIACIQLWLTRATMHVLTHCSVAGPTLVSAAEAVWQRVAPEGVKSCLPCAEPCCPLLMARICAHVRIPWTLPHEDVFTASMSRCTLGLHGMD
jgi:hypothetical protein